jgi:hypothetical protein
LRRHLVAGGRIILGDGIWEVPPTPRAGEALGADPADFPDLTGLLAAARAQGLEPSYGHISALPEWDEYEWSWTGSLTQWALTEAPSATERDEALRAAVDHRRSWLEGYRGVLGFATVILHDVRRDDTRSSTPQNAARPRPSTTTV